MSRTSAFHDDSDEGNDERRRVGSRQRDEGSSGRRRNDNNQENNSQDTSGRVSRLEKPRRPLVTYGLMILLALLHIYHKNVSKQKRVSLKPKSVWKKGEVHRLVTSKLFHSNGIHLAHNLLGMFLCKGVEEKYGSMWLLWMTAVSIVMTSCLYLLVTVSAASIFPHYFGWLWKKGLRGFSGVLFHWKVFKLQQRTTWRFKGFVEVSPDVFLVLLVVYLHLRDAEKNNQLGWLGHVCGIVIGKLHWFGFLSWAMPSNEFALVMEEKVQNLVSSLVSRLGSTFNNNANHWDASSVDTTMEGTPTTPQRSGNSTCASLQTGARGRGRQSNITIDERHRAARLRKFEVHEKVE